jgi:hypothetical protein
MQSGIMVALARYEAELKLPRMRAQVRAERGKNTSWPCAGMNSDGKLGPLHGLEREVL